MSSWVWVDAADAFGRRADDRVADLDVVLDGLSRGDLEALAREVEDL